MHTHAANLGLDHSGPLLSDAHDRALHVDFTLKTLQAASGVVGMWGGGGEA